MKRKKLFLLHILKICVPAFLTILLFAITLFCIIIPSVEKSYLERKQETTKRLVEAQWYILEYYYQLEQQGIRTRKDAQARVIELFRMIRFGKDNKSYFWINDSTPRMIMHPMHPEMEAVNLLELPDFAGKVLYKDIISVIQSDCEGYIFYTWDKHNGISKTIRKLSFVKAFAPWNWVIGTGISIDDVEAEVDIVVAKIVKFSIVILCCVGSLLIIIVVQNIISDKKRFRVEDSISQSQAEYKALVENIDLGVFRSTPHGDGKIVEANTAMARLFGHDSIESYMRQTPGSFYIDITHRAELVEEVIRNNGVRDKELVQRRKDGTTFHALFNVNLKYDETGEIMYLDGIVEDITARKQMAEDKEELLKTLATKKEELESLIYASSHDLRTPLINIQGFRTEMEKNCNDIHAMIDNMKLPDASHKQIDTVVKDAIPSALHHIHFGISKLGNLIDGLLILSQINSITKVNEIVDMEKLINIIIEDKKALFNKNDMVITVGKLPSCKGNTSALKDLFSTLIDNTLYFRHPQSTVRINVAGKLDGDRIIYCIEDNGISIKAEMQPEIFDVFHTVRYRNLSAGEGFGLTIAKRIVDRLDGSICLESVAEYTRFYVSLPV